MGVVDVGLENAARDVVFLAGEGAFATVAAPFDECVLDGKAELGSEVVAGADGDDGAAGIHECLELGDGLFFADAAEPGLELRGHLVAIRISTAPTAASVEFNALVASAGDGAADEEDDVILLAEIAGVDALRIEHVEGELEAFEQEANPAGGHGAAELVPEGDAGGGEFHDLASRAGGDGLGVEAKLGGGLFDDRFG